MRNKVAKRLRKENPKNRISLAGIDATKGEQYREAVAEIIKENNGNMSKYIPAKWGYGPMGGKKY